MTRSIGFAGPARVALDRNLLDSVASADTITTTAPDRDGSVATHNNTRWRG